MAALVFVDGITDVKMEIGWSDQTASTTTPAVVNSLSGATATAADGAVWVFDTDDTGNVGWQGFGVANTTVATKLEPTGIGNRDGDNDPNASEYELLGVALSQGSAKFFRGAMHDGSNDMAQRLELTYVSEWQPSFITATTAITPHILVQTRTTSSTTMRLDALWAWGYRYNSD
jgi:hypothetical protein